MSSLFASVFMGFGAFFAGMFGGHGGVNASTTLPMMHPVPNSAWTASTTAMGGMPMMGMMHNGVFGIVKAIDGTTITVDGHEGTSTAATTTYSVDASNAKIIKGSATTTVSISDISISDHVVVLGTVTGDSIAATTIIDGRFMMGGMRGPMSASSTMGYGGYGYGRGMGSSTMMMWNNGASSTPGMRHPTPGTPPHGNANPGGPMIPYGGTHVNGQAGGQAGMPGGPNVGAGANVNVNVGGGY